MRFDAVIFDIDNVLVDTRASYTDSIRKTVQTYLETILKFKPSRKPLLTHAEIERFKSLGGFNDDWDTCYGLLLYFLSLPVKTRSITELEKRKNIAGFSKSVKTRPLGIKGLEKIAGSNKSVSLLRIADIFQRFYLGGFVWNEKLLIPKNFLKRMKRAGLKLGIVTGRNREEAMLALRRFQIDGLMDAITTIDETPKNRKKPDPYGLLKAAKILGENLRFLYVGDLPDDILAARAAKKKIKIRSCGFLAGAVSPNEMTRELRKAKADYLCKNTGGLKKIVFKS